MIPGNNDVGDMAELAAELDFWVLLSPEPVGDHVLAATGEVLKLSSEGALLAREAVTPHARGLTWFNGKLYVSRFLSGAERGELYVLDAATGRSATDPAPKSEPPGQATAVLEIVTRPPGALNGVFRPASPSIVVPGLGC